MSSRSRALIQQFYSWEQRGRGWSLFSDPVHLEPVFEPFIGHYINNEIIDDGKRPGLLSKLKQYLAPEHTTAPQESTIEDVSAVPYEDSPPLTTYAVAIPKGYALKGETMDRLLTMLALSKEPISFELIAKPDSVNIQFVCREEAAQFIYTQLRAYFPECSIQEIDFDEILLLANREGVFSITDFGLQEECMRPIAYMRGGPDPYTSLFGNFEQLHLNEAIVFQVLFCGAANAWGESIIRAASDGIGGSFFLDAPEMPSLAKEKASQPLFFATVRIAAFSDRVEDASSLVWQSAISLVHASMSNYNGLRQLHTPIYTINERLADVILRQSRRAGMLVNVAELAILAHLPNAQLSKKLLQQHRVTKQAPVNLNDQQYVIGVNEHQGNMVTVGLNVEQRLKHIHIMGATGTGKSTLLHSLMMQDVMAGNGMLCLDPHGDLITGLLSNIPESRVKDVVMIDPTDSEFPIGLNILEAHSDVEREVLASDLVQVFKRFSTSFGDQMHSVLSNAILALLFNTKTYHIGDLRKFLIEPSFRNVVLSAVTDPDIVYYWQKEYPLLKAGGSVGPILIRLDSFLRPKVIRAMMCQTSSIDFGALMDSGKIVLVKLSQGLIGAENSYLLGAFIVAKLQQAAMARQAQAVGNRKPFFAYIDEFHNFVTPSIASILSGARKYGVGLVMAHQDMQQVQRHDLEVASSVLANAATRIYFRLADTDAKRMQEGFSAFTTDNLQNLRVGEAIARVNTADADFNLSVIPYENHEQGDSSASIIAHSRSLYSIPVNVKVTEETSTVISPATPPTPLNYEIQPVPAIVPEQLKTNKVTIELATTIQLTREHRYTQAFIKKLAEEHGYTAHLEVPTPDGHGQVDVLLEKAGVRIAVELSVTNTPENELKNIQKCLTAGFERVVCCSANKKKLAQIKALVTNTVPPPLLAKVLFVTVEDFYIVLTASTSQPPKTQQTVMKGYRVKVQYEDGGVNQQALLQSIMNASKK